MWRLKLDFCIRTDAKGVQLLITAPGWKKTLLLGDQNSFADKETFLTIPSSDARATAESRPEFSSSFLHD
jgi:hypothetical protein